MKDNNGDPAFPVYTANKDNWEFGMSLRDWFAGQALEGMMKRVALEQNNHGKIVATAYLLADAMLKERENGNIQP